MRSKTYHVILTFVMQPKHRVIGIMNVLPSVGENKIIIKHGEVYY